MWEKVKRKHSSRELSLFPTGFIDGFFRLNTLNSLLLCFPFTFSHNQSRHICDNVAVESIPFFLYSTRIIIFLTSVTEHTTITSKSIG